MQLREQYRDAPTLGSQDLRIFPLEFLFRLSLLLDTTNHWSPPPYQKLHSRTCPSDPILYSTHLATPFRSGASTLPGFMTWHRP